MTALNFVQHEATCGELDFILIFEETDGRLVSLDKERQMLILDPT